MGFFYSQLFVTPPYPTQSFAGQTCIVTGANTGLGKEAARHLARLGASKVIIACRNSNAGEEARQDILNTSKRESDSIEVWPLDLASYESIKAFAQRAEALPRIDVLLENAGIAGQDFKLVNGHESNVAINVVSTIYLALLLLPKLKSTAQKFNISTRLVVVSSEVHAEAKFPEQKETDVFATLADESKADMGQRYQLSKLLQILVAKQIAPKLENTGVILNFLNPGLCRSTLGRDIKFPANVAFWIFLQLVGRTIEVGSRTLVASAAGGEDSHGAYMSDGVVENESLSPFVRSDEGKQCAAQVWEQLKLILEKIDPQVTKNL